MGVPFAHTLISIQSTMKGLGKLILNEPALERDLEHCWNVVAEAIQTILRRRISKTLRNTERINSYQ